MKKLLTLLLLPTLAVAQVRTDAEPDFDEQGTDGNTQIEGDLSSIEVNSNNGNVSKTYNGAGSREMPVSSAISPSMISSGPQSCLRSKSGGVQLVGIGISRGEYMVDEFCERRVNAITLSNLGMKIGAISLMCQDRHVWRALLMAATPCPLLKNGVLVVGRRALVEIKANPALWIPDYEDDKAFYDQLLAGGTSNDSEDAGKSISDRFRSTKRERAGQPDQ